MSDVVVRQRTLKRASIRKALPNIDVVKTSSLAKKDYEKEKLSLEKQAAKKQAKELSGRRENNLNTSQDFIEYSKSLNKDVLSPDVKEFLRKNRIRVRKESN